MYNLGTKTSKLYHIETISKLLPYRNLTFPGASTSITNTHFDIANVSITSYFHKFICLDDITYEINQYVQLEGWNSMIGTKLVKVQEFQRGTFTILPVFRTDIGTVSGYRYMNFFEMKEYCSQKHGRLLKIQETILLEDAIKYGKYLARSSFSYLSSWVIAENAINVCDYVTVGHKIKWNGQSYKKERAKTNVLDTYNKNYFSSKVEYRKMELKCTLKKHSDICMFPFYMQVRIYGRLPENDDGSDNHAQKYYLTQDIVQANRLSTDKNSYNSIDTDTQPDILFEGNQNSAILFREKIILRKLG